MCTQRRAQACVRAGHNSHCTEARAASRGGVGTSGPQAGQRHLAAVKEHMDPHRFWLCRPDRCVPPTCHPGLLPPGAWLRTAAPAAAAAAAGSSCRFLVDVGIPDGRARRAGRGALHACPMCSCMLRHPPSPRPRCTTPLQHTLANRHTTHTGRAPACPGARTGATAAAVAGQTGPPCSQLRVFPQRPKHRRAASCDGITASRRDSQVRAVLQGRRPA